MILNLVAIGVAVTWFRSAPGFEPAVVALAALANVAGLYYSKPHWYQGHSRSTVVQKDNRVGGDMAGGNISKSVRK